MLTVNLGSKRENIPPFRHAHEFKLAYCSVYHEISNQLGDTKNVEF